MKVSDIEGILAETTEFVSLETLLVRAAGTGRATWQDLPASPGIYVVSFPGWETRPFSAGAGQARHAEPADPGQLNERRKLILAGGPTDIVYIGKAGGGSSDLRKRLSQLVRFGVGRARNHRGGEWLWQLEGIREAQIGMWTCSRDAPELLKRRLLDEFRADHGHGPLANRI
ncbi:MAG: hypothetical protein OXI87_14290 [Albidovulum sp.]|nr:hypothetical protein [Albidovulum sp.]MDE0532607.1 hypothetical protein [Albidovulum sp.]